MKITPQFLVIDLFCGFGGTTLGFEKTKGVYKVIACVNHDYKAIQSHWLNHKSVKHFNEDIRTLDMLPLQKLLTKWKTKYPLAKVILWASLECTNFSKAKGGKARDADSRTLADHLPRYIAALSPDYIQIENVVEFMAWGPMLNGKPISKRNGEDWLRWCNLIDTMGYYHQWREMNSANYGAYTSRNRLFGCFAKPHLLIKWPEPTHAKKVEATTLFEQPKKKWKAVKDVLNLHLEGESIFGRKIPLVSKSLERIYAGCIKFIALGDESFIAKYYSGRPEGKVIPLSGPCGTIKTADGHALVTANFLLKYNSTQANGKVSPGHGMAEPCPVIATQGRLALVSTNFLAQYYGNTKNGADINLPAGTLTTKDRFSLVSAKQFINRDFSNSGYANSIDQPAGSLMTNPKMNLVTVNPKHHYLINPQYGGNNWNIDRPCFTLIARMDKAPPYIICTESGQISIKILETDSPILIKIKCFMAEYCIIDIKMRMLQVDELLRIQGFPDTYKYVGSKTDAKKFIGNSVESNLIKAWALAMAT